MIKLIRRIIYPFSAVQKAFWIVYYSLILKLFKVQCNSFQITKCMKGHDVIIRNHGHFSIGNNTVLNSCNQIRDSHPTLSLICCSHAQIIIGSDSGISNSTILARNKIVIGNHVMIGADCKIYDNDFHSIKYDDRISEPDTNVQSAPIEIRDGAWVGAHSIILKGTIIGKRAVIGAGSVVAGKIIGDDEMWAGNPARFIKKIDQ